MMLQLLSTLLLRVVLAVVAAVVRNLGDLLGLVVLEVFLVAAAVAVVEAWLAQHQVAVAQVVTEESSS
jgi:hypothetical protein